MSQNSAWPGLAAQADQLVHPTGRRAHGVVLDVAGQREEGVVVEPEAEVVVDGAHDRADERGRRRQPRARGHVGVDLDLERRDVDAAVGEQPERAQHVARPLGHALHVSGPQPRASYDDRVGLLDGPHDQSSEPRRRPGRPGIETVAVHPTARANGSTKPSL